MTRKKRSSKASRQAPLFLRNKYNGENPWDIPSLAKCVLSDSSMELISYKSTKQGDTKNVSKSVHFFIDDYGFEGVYRQPEKSLLKLAQYRCVLTPDFSLYTDMPLTRQLDSIFKSRWCGRYWQDFGLNVLPTVSWGTHETYPFAFLGLERGTSVAISTIGVRKEANLFLAGYRQMMEQVEPSTVYCYGEPIKGMDGHIAIIDYLDTTRRRSKWAEEAKRPA